MDRVPPLVKQLALVALALLLGLFGLSLLVRELAPGESALRRALAVVVHFAGAGFLVGYLSPAQWRMAGFVGWGGAVVGIGTLLGSGGQGVSATLVGLVWFVPLLLALTGAHAGAAVRRWRQR